MKKLFLFIVLFTLSFSLAAAVQVSTNKVEYSGNEVVTATITDCVGTSIAEFRNPSGDVVDLKTGKDSWSTAYNTLSDSADGKYKLDVTCANGPATANFCVDDPGCLGLQTQEEEEDATPPSGGGLFCTPQWSCSEWSFCNKDLQQTRDCVDLNNCELPRQEFRECSQCDESWVCSIWSQCSNSVNLRNCFDEHECGTVLLKPGLQKSCQAAFPPGPQPRQISNQLPPPSFAKPQEPSGLQKFWEDYKLILILGALSLVILVVIILLLVHFLKPKRMAYNLDELKEWVRKERAMGTSNEDIRIILKQHTGWKDKEIDAAFESLRPESQPQPQPEKPSLPEYAAVKEEPGVKVNDQPIVQGTKKK